MNDKIKKDIIILGALIIVSAFMARYFARGETLEDYAKNKESGNVSASDLRSTENNELSNDSNNSNSENIVSDENVTSYEISEGDTDSSVMISDKNDTSTEVISDEKSTNEQTIHSESFTDSFYYEPLSDDIIARIDGISYKENDNISLEDLRYCSLLYNDFNGDTQTGEMICNKDIAQDVIEIFYELYTNGYQIESIKLIDEFNGDDTASMLANNTSCFNYRVVDNTTRLSNHAYGLAIDLNPFYNPYITFNKDGSQNVSPEGSEIYADRSLTFPYKIDENDLAYKIFTAHGFKWGGNWNSVKDYQHFERSR